MTHAGSYTIGIDVGTTFTAAATSQDGRTEVATLGDRSDVIPSVAFLREDDVILVGHAAERRAVADATRVARAFKRRVGDPVPLWVGGRTVTPEALTAAIVRWVVDLVATREGGAPTRTVLTCPASWGDHRRALLLGAAAEAGVGDAELLAEPVAAAMHYSAKHRLPDGATVGVYDLGGGTFDATIVRRVGDGFETVGQPQGDDHIGGIDLDAIVWDHMAGVLGVDAPRPGRRPVAPRATGARPAASGGGRRQGGAVVRHAGGRAGHAPRPDVGGPDQPRRVRGAGPPRPPAHGRRVRADVRGRGRGPRRARRRAAGRRVEPHPHDLAARLQ